MTSGSTPPALPKNEAEYARKLALALLSTLESKGLLTKMDVDTILHVAHRAAMGAEGGDQTAQAAATTPAPAAPLATVLNAPIEVKRPLGPAVLGTRWVKPDTSAPPIRREAADLAHESGAVKVTGQAGSEGKSARPLGPAILTGSGRAQPATALPADEMPVPTSASGIPGAEAAEPGSSSAQESTLPQAPQDNQATHAQSGEAQPGESQSQSAEAQAHMPGEANVPGREPGAAQEETAEKKVPSPPPVVIDFEMD
ncbi:hypothetical protein [Deinococcus cavernae]|uniref:hypothetical protein n=1 Tax=Deinococcus cavernae TaxID=2320857 RepID=UPI0018F3543E|nr:hypothetical protein [Deinococcus cavernae]